jgi:hypothetical protein
MILNFNVNILSNTHSEITIRILLAKSLMIFLNKV